jgi:hypothetical protein
MAAQSFVALALPVAHPYEAIFRAKNADHALAASHEISSSLAQIASKSTRRLSGSQPLADDTMNGGKGGARPSHAGCAAGGALFKANAPLSIGDAMHARSVDASACADLFSRAQQADAPYGRAGGHPRTTLCEVGHRYRGIACQRAIPV